MRRSKRSRGSNFTVTFPVLRKSSPCLSRMASVSIVTLSSRLPPSRPTYISPCTPPATRGTICCRTISRPYSVRVATKIRATTASPTANSTAALTSATRRRRVIRLEVRSDRDGERQLANEGVRLRGSEGVAAGHVVLDPAIGFLVPPNGNCRVHIRRDAVEGREVSARGRREEGGAGAPPIRIVPHVDLNRPYRREISHADTRRVFELLEQDTTLAGSARPERAQVREQCVLQHIREKGITQPEVDVRDDERVAADRDRPLRRYASSVLDKEQFRGIVHRHRVDVAGVQQIDELAELILLIAAHARRAAGIESLLRRRCATGDDAAAEPDGDDRARRKRLVPDRVSSRFPERQARMGAEDG